MTPPVAPTTIGLTLWTATTAGHFLLAAYGIRLAARHNMTRDEWFFLTMLVGVGSLSVVLHAAALVGALNVPMVAALLAGGHAGARWWRGATRPGSTPRLALAPPRVTGILEAAAIVALTASVVGWLTVGPVSLEVRGTDATNYHVPIAVNLALGASPLDLPATQHLYPAVSSTLAAWFIAPVGDGLLVDLVMLLPFLLLTASLGWLFRLATGESGLAWCTWFTLAVFSMPLMRQAALMSADLLFAAAVVSCIAALMRPLLQQRLARRDVLTAGLATGLLIGSKTTGLVAAGLVMIVAVAWATPTRQWRALFASRPGLGPTAAAAALAVGAGGIWLVRNWWLFGSPIAPTGVSVFGLEIFRGPAHEPSTHLSILGDLLTDPDYPLSARTRHFITEWLSPYYLLALLPAGFLIVDRIATAGQPRTAARNTGRWLLLAMALGSAAPMTWLLVGAPWTSLEWTNGLALRYLLPWLVLLPLLAWVAVFPVSWPWYRKALPSAVIGTIVVAGGLLLLHLASDFRPFPPAIGPGNALIAAAALGVLRVIRVRWWTFGLALVAIATLWSAGVANHDAAARDTFDASRLTAQPNVAEALYAAVLDAEVQHGRDCQARRFYALTRFDEALGVQHAAYRNMTFYAGREVAATARTTEPIGRCDYIVTAPALLGTDKGEALIGILNPFGRTLELARTAQFVVLGRQ